LRGAQKGAQSYADFMSRSEVTAYDETNHYVNEWSTAAVAGFDWTMTWIQNGKTDQAKGQDLFFFERHGDTWKAVLRVTLG
jgi:hypothetical protein